MKLNLGTPDLHYDQEFFDAFLKLFSLPARRKLRPEIIIESGTYLGEGTTKMIVDAVNQSGVRTKPPFFTFEADYTNYRKAKQNLVKYSWVNVVHGTSIGVEDAIDFITHDEAILHHEDYPDIYFDAFDPIAFYTAEVKGELAIFGAGKRGEERLLETYLVKYAHRRPLVLLDSAGGIGYLEYQTVLKIMGANCFYLWVHDINHLKHFRSYIHMKTCENCMIVAEKEKQWVLAYFSPLLPAKII